MRFTILLTLLAAAVAYAAPFKAEIVQRIPQGTDNSGPSPHRDEVSLLGRSKHLGGGFMVGRGEGTDLQDYA
uniref:Uncharacterized protein n=1 Tax=Mycena chlorophos TaxID=658473 RepID=A0ABQ0LU71_MYCCL|nr:predicted protein [Mycena chlorophos]